MFNMGSVPSLADIAAVTGNNRDNDGMGNGAWWAWILMFAILGGWGNGNWGFGNNGGGQGVYDTQSVVQRAADTGAIISKLDGLSNGVCNLGYDQLSQMNSLGTTVMQTGNTLMQAVNNVANSGDRNTCQLSHQISDCCCSINQGLSDLKYSMAANTCDLKTLISQASQNIMQNDNANYRALNDSIRDGFTSLTLSQKDQYIAELERKLNACDRANELSNTAQYIINTVRPTPQPSYDVPYPWGNSNDCTGNRCCG